MPDPRFDAARTRPTSSTESFGGERVLTADLVSAPKPKPETWLDATVKKDTKGTAKMRRW